MNRLVVVHCPTLLDEDEEGEILRSFARVVEAVEAYCPWVTTVRPGICSLPAAGRPATSAARTDWPGW